MSKFFHRRAAILSGLGLWALVGCGPQGRVTQTFFPEEPDTLEPEDGYEPPAADTRIAIQSIVDVTLAPTPGGIIVHATGLAQTTGYWDAGLVARRDASGDTEADGGELRLVFRARPPVTISDVTNPNAREVRTAVFLTEGDLIGVRRITVIGQTNEQSVTVS